LSEHVSAGNGPPADRVVSLFKGMPMLIYGVDAEVAFGLLKWRSQETNVKLRLLAQQLLDDFLAACLTQGRPMPKRR
jgi:hypothetical protein